VARRPRAYRLTPLDPLPRNASWSATHSDPTLRQLAPVSQAPAPVETDRPSGDELVEADVPWLVICWNDPINLMSYVTFIFQKLFGYPLPKAERLMLEVHHRGKAVVSSGSREKAELDCFRLHEHGLWATMQRSS
jgi:ATP-dependent Clp protease adaptor protein ClpS